MCLILPLVHSLLQRKMEHLKLKANGFKFTVSVLKEHIVVCARFYSIGSLRFDGETRIFTFKTAEILYFFVCS